MAKFETIDLFKELLVTRERLRDLYEDEILKMVSGQDYNKTAIVFVVNSIDSDEAALLDLLESDLSDFFFGCPVVIETNEVNKDRKTAALKSFVHKFTHKNKTTDGQTTETKY